MAKEPLILVPGVLCDADLYRDQVPALVLCGREDAATPLAMSREIAAAIPGARLEIVEDCGHLSTMERPALVNAALLRWPTV